MQMKASRISGLSLSLQSETGLEMQLTGALSEWLFATRFWQEFNVAHGTMFDQFEEDEVGRDVASEVAKSINERINSAQASVGKFVEFTYRQLPNGKFESAQITKRDLIDELIRLRNFLISAAEHCEIIAFDL